MYSADAATTYGAIGGKRAHVSERLVAAVVVVVFVAFVVDVVDERAPQPRLPARSLFIVVVARRPSPPSSIKIRDSNGARVGVIIVIMVAERRRRSSDDGDERQF